MTIIITKTANIYLVHILCQTLFIIALYTYTSIVILTYLMLIMILKGSNYYYHHFIDEETETSRRHFQISQLITGRTGIELNAF